VGLPYLHGAWHILIFLASYTAIVLFAYFEVKNHNYMETPILR
jgi:alkaline ceramidase